MCAKQLVLFAFNWRDNRIVSFFEVFVWSNERFPHPILSYMYELHIDLAPCKLHLWKESALPFHPLCSVRLKVEGSPLNPLLSNSFDVICLVCVLQLFSHRSELKGNLGWADGGDCRRRQKVTQKGTKIEEGKMDWLDGKVFCFFPNDRLTQISLLI